MRNMSKITTQTAGSIHTITLHDPPLNILDIAMLTDLRDTLGAAPTAVHAIVITSAGEKAFSAGASVQDHLGDRVETMLSVFHDCFRILNRIDPVTIAVVRGAALGGGCELALACDFVLASRAARFGQPEINLGVFPPVAAYQLSRQMPPRLGLELLLTGDSITAERAFQLGVVNALFEPAELETGSAEWIARLTRQSRTSVQFAKQAFRIAAADDFEQRLARVEQLYLDELMKTADATEGLNAFLEKRKPVWQA